MDSKCFGVGLLCVVTAFHSGRLVAQDSSVERIPEPNLEAQKKAQKVIRDLLKEDYTQTSPESRKALAGRLLNLARETRDDPVARYVLYREAYESASEAGDGALALAAIREISRRYAVDVTSLINSLLESVVQSAKEPHEAKASAEVGLEVAEEMMSLGDLHVAGRAAELAASLAPKANDNSVLVRANAKVKDIAECRPRYDGVKKALEKITAGLGDEDSHLLVGKFKCLVRDCWKEGLPHLAKGSDPALKDQAMKDLAGPKEPAAILAVADGWWSLSETESKKEREGMRRRALSWYEIVAPSLSGLSRLRVDKRMAEAVPKPVAKEYVLLSADIRGSGAMKLRVHPELKDCWTCQEDVTSPELARNTYVEFEFNAMAENSYLCWIYAGACCDETFTVYLQATDMVGPNPRKASEKILYDVGGGIAAPVEPRIKGLKKMHKDHGGEKQATTWGWVAIPLPKYTNGGLKKVRLLSENKGYSVGMVLVSPTRKTPPSGDEMRQLIKGSR